LLKPVLEFCNRILETPPKEVLAAFPQSSASGRGIGGPSPEVLMHPCEVSLNLVIRSGASLNNGCGFLPVPYKVLKGINVR